MTEIVKFQEKNIAILGKIETTVGTYNAPAATDGLAATTMTAAINYSTGSAMFLGDSLSREEYTFQKDSFAEVTVETLQQVLGALLTSLTVAAAPFSQWIQACGGFVTINSTTGQVTYDNVTASDSTLSIDYRKTSVQDTTNQKLFKFLALRGMVDINASIGEVPKLKFSFKGTASAPIASPILVANFGAQTSLIASTVRKQNIITANISPAIDVTSITSVTTVATVVAPAHGLTTGNVVSITGATGTNAGKYNLSSVTATVTDVNTFTYPISTLTATATGNIMVANNTLNKEFSFSTLNAPNFFGFDLVRYLTGTEEGFSKVGIPSDVSIIMLEDQTGGASFDPDINLSNFFAITLKFGTGAGKYVTYQWNKLQLADVKEGKVGNLFGRDIKFRNTGNSFIILN
jgi:hypothetical protein